MKTWIANNQLLSVVIVILFLVGVYYLVTYLNRKYGKSSSRINPNSIGIDNETVDSIPTVGVFSMSPNAGNSMGPGHASGGPSGGPAAGAGARVSGGAGKGTR